VTGRRRTRHQVTLSPEHVKKINARMAAAKDAGYRTSFSGEIDRCIDEAEGNLRTARHALRGSLSTLTAMLALMRRELDACRRITTEDLKSIEDTVATMTRRLDPPSSASCEGIAREQ